MRTKQPCPSPHGTMLAEGAYIATAFPNDSREVAPNQRHTWAPPSLPAVTETRPALSSPSRPPYPSSPPPLVHSKSPYANVPLPPLLPYEEGELTLNSILNTGSMLSTMQWDVRTSPSSILGETRPGSQPRSSSQGRQQQDDWHHQPASSPCLNSIVIRSAAVDGPILVFPSGTKHSFITAYDVLDAVHRAIRLAHVGANDEQKPSRKGNQLDGASLLFKRSTTRGTFGKPDREWGGASWEGGWRWGGLTASSTERDVWILSLY